VVLIDEIDKADPDMPNGMLVPLGSSEFEVTDTRTRVRLAAAEDADAPQRLIVITTNEERELPQAFIRRCVVTWVPEPTREHLVEVARTHRIADGATFTEPDRELAEELAVELMRARAAAPTVGIRKPSTAEFLDAFRALRRMNIEVGSPDWERLRMLTLVKDQRPKG